MNAAVVVEEPPTKVASYALPVHVLRSEPVPASAMTSSSVPSAANSQPKQAVRRTPGLPTINEQEVVNQAPIVSHSNITLRQRIPKPSRNDDFQYEFSDTSSIISSRPFLDSTIGDPDFTLDGMSVTSSVTDFVRTRNYTKAKKRTVPQTAQTPQTNVMNTPVLLQPDIGLTADGDGEFSSISSGFNIIARPDLSSRLFGDDEMEAHPHNLQPVDKIEYTRYMADKPETTQNKMSKESSLGKRKYPLRNRSRAVNSDNRRTSASDSEDTLLSYFTRTRDHEDIQSMNAAVVVEEPPTKVASDALPVHVLRSEPVPASAMTSSSVPSAANSQPKQAVRRTPGLPTINEQEVVNQAPIVSHFNMTLRQRKQKPSRNDDFQYEFSDTSSIISSRPILDSTIGDPDFTLDGMSVTSSVTDFVRTRNYTKAKKRTVPQIAQTPQTNVMYTPVLLQPDIGVTADGDGEFSSISSGFNIIARPDLSSRLFGDDEMDSLTENMPSALTADWVRAHYQPGCSNTNRSPTPNRMTSETPSIAGNSSETNESFFKLPKVPVRFARRSKTCPTRLLTSLHDLLYFQPTEHEPLCNKCRRCELIPKYKKIARKLRVSKDDEPDILEETPSDVYDYDSDDDGIQFLRRGRELVHTVLTTKRFPIWLSNLEMNLTKTMFQDKHKLGTLQRNLMLDNNEVMDELVTKVITRINYLARCLAEDKKEMNQGKSKHRLRSSKAVSFQGTRKINTSMKVLRTRRSRKSVVAKPVVAGPVADITMADEPIADRFAVPEIEDDADDESPVVQPEQAASSSNEPLLVVMVTPLEDMKLSSISANNARKATPGTSKSMVPSKSLGPRNKPPGPSSQPPGPSTRPPVPSIPPPGPRSRRPGPRSRRPGPSSRRPRPSSRQPGPSSRQPGPSSRPPGPSTRPPRPSSRPPGPSSQAPRQSSPLQEPSSPPRELTNKPPGPSSRSPGPSTRPPGPSSRPAGPSNQAPRQSSPLQGPSSPPRELTNKPPGPSSRPHSSQASPRRSNQPKPQYLDAPVFRPTLKEFEDPFGYIRKIEEVCKPSGICKIIPPAGFEVPCHLDNNSMFTTMNQYLGRLYQRWGPTSREFTAIQTYMAKLSHTRERDQFVTAPMFDGVELDIVKLYHIVLENGGIEELLAHGEKWTRVAEQMSLVSPRGKPDHKKLEKLYCKHVLPYESLSQSERQQNQEIVDKVWLARSKRAFEHSKPPLHDQKRQRETEFDDDEEMLSDRAALDLHAVWKQCFDRVDECTAKGRIMNLSTFRRIGSQIQAMRFGNGSAPTTSDIEHDYWDILSHGTEHVCVLSAFIDTSVDNLGHTSDPEGPGGSHAWNLKRLSENPENILRSLGKTLKMTVPTLCLNQMHSTKCWHMDPHKLSWMDYMHEGPAKIWYAVSEPDSEQFRRTMEILVPSAVQNKGIWLTSDTIMVPPCHLTERGVKLRRIEQNPGEFIVVFPGACASTVATGLTISERIYFQNKNWIYTIDQIFQQMHRDYEPVMFSSTLLLFHIALDPDVTFEVLPHVLVCTKALLYDEYEARHDAVDLKCKIIEDQTDRAGLEPISWTHQEECSLCRAPLILSKTCRYNDPRVLMCLKHGLRVYECAPVAERGPPPPVTLLYSHSKLRTIVRTLDKRISGIVTDLTTGSRECSHIVRYN